MRPRLAILTMLAASCLTVPTACGVSDEERVNATVKRFYRAAAEGDGKEACAQLTPSARGLGGAPQCEAAIEQLGQLGGAEAKRRIANVDVRRTRVDGDRATTQTQVPGQTPVVLTLRKVEGEWKLESIGAQFGASLESG
jgi:hypothetical protein